MNLKRKLISIGKFILLFIVVFALVYSIVNAPALYQKLKYWYTTKFKKQPWPQSYQVMPINLQNNLGYILSPQKKPEEIKEIDKQTQQTGQPVSSEVTLENNHLYIPKIGVTAPVHWGISENDALKFLETGLVHLQGTGLPGTDGNVFITGHSSYYWWARGNYKTVFALLPNLDIGEKIYLGYANQLYIYEITEKLIVYTKDIWVVDKLQYPALSLMTCVPVGTNLQRLIVRAKQISPTLQQEKPKKHQPEIRPAPNLLPAIF